MTTSLRAPIFSRRLDELGRHSDLCWFVGLNVGLGFTLIAAYLFPSEFWEYAGLFTRAAIYLWAGVHLRGRGGETLDRLFRLGIVAGIFELLVDFGLGHWVEGGRLVYLTGNDIVLLASPVWMPLAWACVIVELGYPAVRLYSLLRNRLSLTSAATVSSITIAVLAGVTVGFYEYFGQSHEGRHHAYRANWWKYEAASAMLGDYCALFIPFGEFLMFLPVLWIAAFSLRSEERSDGDLILGGGIFAICIAAGYSIAYLVLET